MATWTPHGSAHQAAEQEPIEDQGQAVLTPVGLQPSAFSLQPFQAPRGRTILAAVGLALAFVLLTRWPVARAAPLDPDEFGFLGETIVHWFPMHHTLFLAMGRVLGELTGNPYLGFILLDMVCSALALVSVWWWLRALVRPGTAAGAALLLGVGPVYWGYGAMAGNYTAIVLVGAWLLGIAYRAQSCPRTWHPFAAAVVLAAGTGYRQDIGLFWLPVFLVILWQHRWKRAIVAGILFTILNLAWLVAMLGDVGGWARYHASTAEFGYEAGARNSIWNLGLIDGPVRYAVKIGMALIWTLGPALVFVPRGFTRLRQLEHGRFLGGLIGLSVMPALAFHLLVHFGVPGYSFHYIPALIALVALGIGRCRSGEDEAGLPATATSADRKDHAVPRLIGAAAMLAAAFWFYPTNYSAPGWRGDFDLAFCRFTRTGLAMPVIRVPTHWRTDNSRDLAGKPLSSPEASFHR
jgi:hypothetical protein